MIKRRGRKTLPLRRVLFTLPLWIIASLWMWLWWFSVDQVNINYLYVILSIAMLYEFFFLPTVFLYFVLRAKSPPKRIGQKNLKVAVIAPCVPSQESVEIVERQLVAMSKIEYPHDSWLLDEGGSKKLKQLAKKYGVKYFTRKGIKKYNQPIPPLQKKTKAGNINAWLDHVKRRKYDYFVQLDVDHIPKPNYLHKTLGYFRDDNIAWVQAPSVYSNRDYWTSRGSIEQELVLQGPLQMGFYGHSNTPYIIGSHCTYRMSAIREIGGFQPTRAEDHLDTVVLSNRGYKGVFLPEIIAEGDGPETLSIYLAQQYAWAYSMFQVLTTYTLKNSKILSLGQKLQFLFSQTWYPLWSISYLILFITPLLAILHKKSVVTVGEFDMIIHFLPTFIAGFIVWIAARPLMQPEGVWITWRGMILHAVRWPIILLAIFSAMFKVKKTYMITPKGKHVHKVPYLKTYQPFLALGFLSVFVALYALVFHSNTAPSVEVLFALTNAGFMFSVCAIDLSIRFKQRRPSKKEFKTYWLKPLTATSVLALFLLSTMGSHTYKSSQYVFARKSDNSASILIYNSGPVHYDMNTDYLIERIKKFSRESGHTPDIGIYNPDIDKTNPKPYKQYIEHNFVDWRDTDLMAYYVAKSLESNSTPLLTIEPRGEEDGAKLLVDITAGRYDDRIEAIKNILTASKRPVYVRFAHEMELGLLYPWGNQDYDQYKKTYRYFVDKVNLKQNEVKWIWSPAGNYGAELYYPGDEYVDVIGTTILHDKFWYGNYTPSFRELSLKREWLLNFGKPVWIVEFGAGNSNPEQQTTVINAALTEYKTRGYSALIYINAKDANLTDPDYRLPIDMDFAEIFTKPPTIAAEVLPGPKEPPKKVEAPVSKEVLCEPNILSYFNNVEFGTPTKSIFKIACLK